MSSQNQTVNPYMPPGFVLPDGDKAQKTVMQFREDLTARLVNLREIGLYQESIQPTGQKWPSTSSQPDRVAQRIVIDFGTLPNTTTKTVASITVAPTFQLTHLYAAASDPTGFTYLPIPYAHPTPANSIALDASLVLALGVYTLNVTITTGSNRSNYTQCYVVVEFLP